MTNPIGFLFAAIAVLAFGSNFTITKKYKTGDGLSFQFFLSSGIFTVGLLFYFYQCGTLTNGLNGGHQCPSFQPFAMLGGALWATGNMFTVPIVKTIGLSLGLLVWGMANMIIGWASARFGLLGSLANDIAQPTLNSVGVCIAVLSMGVFYFIKPSVEKVGGGAASEQDAAYSTLYEDDELGKSLNAEGGTNEAEGDEEKSWTDALTPAQKSLFGFGGSVLSGLLYGVNFNPPTYVTNHMCLTPPSSCPDQVIGYPQNCNAAEYDNWQPNKSGCFNGTGNVWDNQAKNLIFSHFTGIWLTSITYFLIYCMATKNTPKIFSDAAFPGVVSGMIWAVAQVSWFFANANLGQATSFPIIS